MEGGVEGLLVRIERTVVGEVNEAAVYLWRPEGDDLSQPIEGARHAGAQAVGQSVPDVAVLTCLLCRQPQHFGPAQCGVEHSAHQDVAGFIQIAGIGVVGLQAEGAHLWFPGAARVFFSPGGSREAHQKSENDDEWRF